MNFRFLLSFSTRKNVLSSCFFLLVSLFSFGQSETHDFITYDTVINYSCIPEFDGCTGQAFTVRISRPRNYFVAGNSDTASRPWLVTMPGLGEVGRDTSVLSRYGPHSWIKKGWDGGIQLRNGKHYPILITVIASSRDVRPGFVQALMDTLYRRYHPRTNSVHMAALSMGVEVLGWYLGYEKTAGDEHNMANVRSFVDLEGEAPGDYYGAGLTYPSFFGHWAKKYGGRFLGLEGSQDSRNIWQISENMNDSVASSAYFTFQTFGGGAHCCWDSLYDPSVTNWRDVSPVTNPRIAPNYFLHPNVMGNYSVDAVTGTNLFQWMLRQGDTTLVGSGTPPPNLLPVANAGPDKTITLPLDSVVVTGSGTDADGSITGYAWTKLSGSGGTISSPSSATTTFKGLSAGIYQFILTVTDNSSGTGKDTMTVTVDTAAYVPPSVSAGSGKSVTLPVDSVVLMGTATGNGTTIHTLTWNKVSGPNTPTIVLTNSGQTATIHGLIQGTYLFAIVATDNHGLSGTDTVTVVVNPAIISGTLKTLVAPGEYQVFFIDSSKHLYGVGSNLVTLGSNETGTPGTTIPLAVDSGLRFKTAAGGLHGGAAVDMTGNVWSWGDNDQGQVGNGSVSSTQVTTPVQLTTDSAGNPFTGITALYSYYSGNLSEGWYAIKSDSSLWVWGQTLGGMRGNGTAGSTSTTRPVQVPLPGGRKVVKIATGDNLIVLFSDSTVWTCGGSNGNASNLGYTVSGNSYLSLHQLTTLSGIKDIAGGGPFNYALKSNDKLYGWGYYGNYMGGTADGDEHLTAPTDLTTRLSLSHPIRSVAVNMNCSYAILSDSSLWAWGDNAQGCIGNGLELDYSATPDPYAWDYSRGQLLQRSPVQVTSRKDFVAVFAIYPFVMYAYAETADGQLYSWGRNKGAILGNGIVGCSSDVVATYPNSWDVTTPTAIHPLTITTTTVGPCPYCVAHPATSPCNTCSMGSRDTPKKANATGTNIDGAGSTADQFLLYPTITSDNETLTMALTSDSIGPVRIRLYDINGKIWQTLQANKRGVYFSQSLQVGRLPAGMYFVQTIIGNDKQFIGKFIRQ